MICRFMANFCYLNFTHSANSAATPVITPTRSCVFVLASLPLAVSKKKKEKKKSEETFLPLGIGRGFVRR